MSTTELLRLLHVPGNYIGFRQLCRAVDLAVRNEDALFHIYRDIYEVIASETGVKIKAVEKNIRTVISVAWIKGCKSSLSRLVGFSVEMKPRASEFIDLVSSYLRAHAAEEVSI